VGEPPRRGAGLRRLLRQGSALGYLTDAQRADSAATTTPPASNSSLGAASWVLADPDHVAVDALIERRKSA
jgi:hypothetical protein